MHRSFANLLGLSKKKKKVKHDLEKKNFHYTVISNEYVGNRMPGNRRKH